MNYPEISIIPASAVYICLFIVSLIQGGVSCSIIDEVRYGIKWFHDVSGFGDPCKDSMVTSLLEAAKRILSQPVRKKEPFTPDMIHTLFTKFGHPLATLADLRVLVISVLSYVGFLRSSEVLNLRRCDFQFEPTFVRVFIEKSKTDIYRDGAWVVIARTFSSTCPVQLIGGISPLEMFLRIRMSLSLDPLRFLAKQVVINSAVRNPYPMLGLGK
jgi:hypothetical protein